VRTGERPGSITYDAPTVTVPDRIACREISPVTLCANAGNGVSPYTYRWSNGATTQCIAVSDTGRYQVTITDAKGCQATGGGSFRHRDCIGQLAHTSTTCETFMGGTADDLPSSDVHYNVSNGIISTISPGVFFTTRKWSRRARTSRSARAVEEQPDIPVLRLSRPVVLYCVNCNRVATGVRTSPDRVRSTCKAPRWASCSSSA
jgi:hypothetical protein